jgi:thioredoxin 1
MERDGLLAVMSMSNVNDLDDAKFRGFVEKSRLALVDFYADWCGPCHALSPVLEKLSEELKGKVAFGKLNIDSNRETAGKYGIMSIPTLIIFKNGKLADRLVGAMPAEMIRQRLNKIMA